LGGFCVKSLLPYLSFKRVENGGARRLPHNLGYTIEIDNEDGNRVAIINKVLYFLRKKAESKTL
jgi:hypothetical protein